MSHETNSYFQHLLIRKIHLVGWQKLEGIALGIAEGIEYLYQSYDKRILHFDIKSFCEMETLLDKWGLRIFTNFYDRY